MGGISKYLGNCVSVGQLRSLKHSYFIICGNEKPGYCTRVGTFGTESAVRKRGGSRNLPYLNAKPRQIPLLDTYACTVTKNPAGMVAFGGKLYILLL